MDFGEAAIVSEFLAGFVSDVEDIEDLVEVGGNFREADREFERSERGRDRVEQAAAVFGKDVDDRKFLGRRVIDDDAGGLGGERFARNVSEAGVAAEETFDGAGSGEDVAEGRFDFSQAELGDCAGVVAVDDAKAVHDNAGCGGADLGGENLQPFGGQGPGDAAEETGTDYVARDDAVFDGRRRRIEAALDPGRVGGDLRGVFQIGGNLIGGS